MRITFDYQVFGSQARGGISRYFLELARHLAELDDCQVEILAPAYVNVYLRDGGLGLLARPAVYDRLAGWSAFSSRLTHREARLRRSANRRLSRRRLLRTPPDILHETLFETDPLPLTTGRRVITVQDMIDELFLAADGRTSPEFLSVKRAAILRADHVICASAQTRADLLKLLPIPETRTSVVYHGCQSADDWPRESGPGVPLPPFLLFVGSRDTYKNFDGLLRAYASSPRVAREFTLVFFGGGAFTPGERQLAAGLGIAADRLQQIEGDDPILVGLYRQAQLCVYPSHYEGFGFIPLEAMTFGCPVVTSHQGSLREVVADAAEIVDPGKPASIAAGLERVAFDQARRAQLREAGFARARRFTWHTCAAETRAVYDRMLA